MPSTAFSAVRIAAAAITVTGLLPPILILLLQLLFLLLSVSGGIAVIVAAMGNISRSKLQNISRETFLCRPSFGVVF